MSQYPPLIIDMHTHLFNARYVPLNKILRSRKVPPGLSNLISRLVIALTRKSKLKKSEYTNIADGQSEESALIDNISSEAIEQWSLYISEYANNSLEQDSDFSEMIYDIQNSLEDTELYQALLDIHQEYGNEQTELELSLEHLNTTFNLAKSKGEPFAPSELKGLFGGLKSMLKKLLKKAIKFVEHAGDLLDFVYTMLRSEKKLLKRLTKYYRPVNDYLMVHHMMDMQYPFNGKVKYDYYKKQLPRMTSLERYSKGKAIGFSAFDPIRFVKNGASKEIIIQHIENALSLGKAGFKFYPPMNYKAAGNEDSPKLERVIDIFFDYCAANQVPVFTHCTPEGFEVVPGKTGHNGHPKYWELALTKDRPHRNNLILCFGHAGGGKREANGETVYGWLSSTEEQWDHHDNYAKYVVELCRRFPNVYCEISYIHEIIHDAHEKTNLKNRLIQEFSRSTSDELPYHIKDKIMYGTDWHMPSMVNDINHYLEYMVDIFNSDELSEHREQFFSKNAIRYLQLASFIQRAGEQLSPECQAELERKYNL